LADSGRRRASRFGTTGAWLRLVAALVLLNASLTFTNIWPTPKIEWANALSLELAVAVLLLAIGSRNRPWLVRYALPACWIVLAVGHYLDTTGPALYGRDFSLYWDSPHILNVVAMFTRVSPWWLLAAIVAGAAVTIVVAFLVARLAFDWIERAMASASLRRGLSALATLVVIVFAAQHLQDDRARVVSFADPVTPAYVRQARTVLAMVGPGVASPAIAASPAALSSKLRGLGGADVMLVFVESYGAVAFESPALAAALVPSRTDFESAVGETGRRVVSAFVESPTFGASSWLAHLSLITGVEVSDQYTYQVLMTQPRETLVTTFARAGYRVVALMPGMRQAWPEGAFYRYDTIYGREGFEYSGPEFGWWSIPDQYALAKFDELEGPRASRPPLFAVFPTSTSHAPFGPVAPYQPDWSKALTGEAYDPDEVARILARPPQWMNMSADWSHAMSYEFTTFAGYLRTRRGDDLVMVLVGDHQPPAMVSGKNAPWTVPVHIVTSREAVLERLLEFGFTEGVTPRRPPLGKMHELVPMLMHSFDAEG
jgi:hypothetical protein